MEESRIIWNVEELPEYLILRSPDGNSPSLDVFPHRLQYVEPSSANQLGSLQVGNSVYPLNADEAVRNTGIEQFFHGNKPYIGNITWPTAVRLVSELEGTLLRPQHILDLKQQLEAGIDSKGKVLGPDGKPISSERLKPFYDEMFLRKGESRGTFLGETYKVRGNDVYAGYKFDVDDEGNIHVVDCEKIDADLMKRKANELGLGYFSPLDGAVAWFFADSGRSYFDCGRLVVSSDSSLGVLVAREHKE